MVSLPRVTAERTRLIHVEPDTRELDPELSPIPQSLCPPCLGVLCEPVRESLIVVNHSIRLDKAWQETYCVTRPNLSDVEGSVRILDERIAVQRDV